MRVSNEWPIDATVFILTQVLKLSYAELSVLCRKFPIDAYTRIEMEYHRETRRLLEERERYYAEREEKYLEDMSYHNIYFWEIIPEHWTSKIKQMAVRMHHPNIWRIPEEERTYDIWLVYAEKTGELTSIPVEHWTYQICMVCMVVYPAMLKHVPTPFMTRKMLDVAEGWR
jgi:hypothetical protein